MTREQASRLQKCPDCNGDGRIKTPATNWAHAYEKCDRCSGKGYIDPEWGYADPDRWIAERKRER